MRTTEEMISYYEELVEEFPIFRSKIRLMKKIGTGGKAYEKDWKQSPACRR